MENLERQNVAVYGDLTALYAARSKFRKQINYEALDSVLKNIVGLESDQDFDFSSFYTLYSATNEKQVSFVKTLSEYNWAVNTVHPREVRRGRPIDHRFDADISFDIGLGTDEYKKILVVSDSYELARTLQNFAREDEEWPG